MTNDKTTLVTHYAEDLASVDRIYTGPYSQWHAGLLSHVLDGWSDHLRNIDFASLRPSEQADIVLLRLHINAKRRDLELGRSNYQIISEFLSFSDDLVRLEEERVQKRFSQPEEIAESLSRSTTIVNCAAFTLNTDPSRQASMHLKRVLNHLDALLSMLENWYRFFDEYDPEFHWWVSEPFAQLTMALNRYRDEISRFAAIKTPFCFPLGKKAIETRLRDALVFYSSEELLEAGEREMLWTEKELIEASRDLGFGDCWRCAVDHVKQDHLPPGQQPEYVTSLAAEAIEYVESHDLVTVPPLAKTCWQIEMMSAERQKVNPFFLGGETLVLSFPTVGMTHEEKKMSQRGNNRSFARATVQHELIPGHHLQSYYQNRFRPDRRIFYTPFWVEGWTLHWEMLLWELGFAKTAEEKIGMLFWRRHRAARVIFSLRYHLGQMTASDCVEYLVAESCHERKNAEAEVRRSFEGNYDPLYQLAYLIGGQQVHALYNELTGNGTLSPREFHDSFLKLNSMPIVLARALLCGGAIDPDGNMPWRFLA